LSFDDFENVEGQNKWIILIQNASKK